MKYDPPAAPAAREMLERVLSSQTFRRSERARSLLAYLVEREQAGESELLKGYTIGVDVFGKDQEFDSSADAAVRVQAGRLRELLAQYYQTEGRADPLRIVVPRGHYVPSYEEAPTERRNAASSETMAEPARPSPMDQAARGMSVDRARPDRADSKPRRMVGMGHVRALYGALAFIAMLLAIVGYRAGQFGSNPATASAALPTRLEIAPGPTQSEAALPTIRVVVRSNDAATRRIKAEFSAAFAGFDLLDLIDSDFAAEKQGLVPDPASFALIIAGGDDRGGVRLELKSLASGTVLLNRVLPEWKIQPDALADAVAGVASSIAPIRGLIYSYLEQAGLKSRLAECLTLKNVYFAEQGPAQHEAAYRCLEKLAASDAKSPLVYSELGALHIDAKIDRYSYPPNPSEEQAMALARQGLQYDPTSPIAHRALSYVYARMGNRSESIRWMRKAYELNTYDLNMAGTYGYVLVLSGNYDSGATILQRAMDASSVHSSSWDYGLFLAELMRGNIDRAAQATDALLTPKKPYYLAARLVAAHLRGDRLRTEALAAELRVSYPEFAADPEAVYRDGHYPPDLAAKLVDALRIAGIGAAS